MEAATAVRPADTFEKEINTAIASQDASGVLRLVVQAFTLFAAATHKVETAIGSIMDLKAMPGFSLAEAVRLLDAEMGGEGDKARANTRTLVRILLLPGVGVAPGDKWKTLLDQIERASTSAQRNACVVVVENHIANQRLKNAAYGVTINKATELVKGLFVKPRPEQAPEVLIASGAKSLKNAAVKFAEKASAGTSDETAAVIKSIIDILQGIVTSK